MANHLSFLLFSVAFCSTAHAVLQPSEVAVLANSTFPGSRDLAEYYCRTRNIPGSHIICFAMPDGEAVARSLYEKSIVPQVRQALAKMPDSANIRCLVTVRGVPLRIGSAQPSDEQRSLITTLTNNRQLALTELNDLLAQAQRLTGLPVFPSDSDSASAVNRGSTLVKRTLDAVNQAAGKIYSLPESLYKQGLVKDFVRIQDDLLGLAGQIDLLKSQGPFDAGDPRSIALVQLQAQLTEADRQVSQLIGHDATLARLDQAAGITRRSRGVLGLIQQLDACVALIKYPYQDSNSSFDSELSLVLADDYPVHDLVVNNLCLEYPADQPKTLPTLMVSRLDAPTDAIARNIINMAVSAERTGLAGTCYIDTGWSRAGRPGYKRTENSLLAAADIVSKQARFPVVLDKDDAVFAPGSCPNAALYCGWYSLRNYVDAFDWAPGAVGYHIASFELTSLRDPKYNGWATAMIRDGITATLGSVNEPRLAAFPPPDRFFTLLLTGRYSLVECFYLTQRFNSWQLVLIGDPLYSPFAKSPRLSISEAEKILNHKLP